MYRQRFGHEDGNLNNDKTPLKNGILYIVSIFYNLSITFFLSYLFFPCNVQLLIYLHILCVVHTFLQTIPVSS